MRLAHSLPGRDAQYLMAPMHRERIETETLKAGQYKPSAVMIVFCRDANDQLFIPLIQRASYNGVHSGQISFPGGKFEEGDVSLENTAVRECFEEIGLKDLELIGKLTSLYIPVSGFLVEPYVAWCKMKDPVMMGQQREVVTVLKMPVSDLLNDSRIQNGHIELSDHMTIKTNWYALEQSKVWGATAMILSELKEAIKDVF